MDILSNLTNLLGDAMSQPQGGRAQSGGAGGLGGLGALAGMLGGSGFGGGASADPLGGLGGLVGALLGGGGAGGGMSGGASMLSGIAGMLGGASGAGAAGGLGGIGALIGTLMGGQGGGMLSQLLGGEQAPPAPQAHAGNLDQARAVNTLRALVYAARADGKLDDQEKQSIGGQIQKAGLTQEGQRLVNQFLGEDVDPAKIAGNITSPEEALQIYALSCAITKMDSFMEKNYLDALAQSLRIPPQTKVAIEQRIAG